MKKLLFSIIFILLFSSVAPEARAGNVTTGSAKDLIHLLFNSGNKESGQKFNRKKLKKIVRKAGRVYRTVKQDRDSRMKSRKVQRTARRIINIF